jgi:sugar phosphate isomerase/epimerase
MEAVPGMSRRQVLRGLAGMAILGPALAKTGDERPAKATQGDTTMGFRYALNTSTLRGYKLGIVEQIEVTAAAGYQGIEPWLGDVDDFTRGGGRLAELRQRLDGHGLQVPDAIAFWKWADADAATRTQALEQARREMDTIAALGGTAAAAPPLGNVASVSLDAFAEGYARLCEIGQAAGVAPLLELWGHSPKLSRLAELLYVAAASGRADARLLLDVYHLYKGGNSFESLRLLSATSIGLFHVNDYPAQPPRTEIGDQHRVWPGDGVAPLRDIAATLRSAGYTGFLSLELFNPDYWRGEALATARTGLAKTRAAFGG